MKKKSRIYKENNGITLVTLVITIFVVIIISAVSIGNMYDGEGMIEQAEKVENITNIKLLEKQIKQDILTEQLNTGNVTREEINTILNKYNAVLNESDRIIIENGKYEISLIDIYNGEIVETE